MITVTEGRLNGEEEGGLWGELLWAVGSERGKKVKVLASSHTGN